MLVTGATGFLGGWLVGELIERGARVVAIVRRKRANSQFFLAGYHRQVKVVWAQVWDSQMLERTIEQYQIDFIFHTAMSGGDVQATLAEPIECLRSTVESTWCLLDVIRRNRTNAVMIVCSSDKAYGAQKTPYREQQALQPRHPQEVAKASQDLLTQSFGKVYDLNVAVTRCGNFFGPYDFNFTRIIPYISKCCALRVRPELRSDGNFVRDFLAVREAAIAHLILAEALASRPELRGEVFNFSYELQLTVMEIMNQILGLAKIDLAPIVANSVLHEIPNMRLSCDKARQVLGWTTAQSFYESLEVTVFWYLNWFRNRPSKGILHEASRSSSSCRPAT